MKFQNNLTIQLLHGILYYEGTRLYFPYQFHLGHDVYGNDKLNIDIEKTIAFNKNLHMITHS